MVARVRDWTAKRAVRADPDWARADPAWGPARKGCSREPAGWHPGPAVEKRAARAALRRISARPSLNRVPAGRTSAARPEILVAPGRTSAALVSCRRLVAQPAAAILIVFDRASALPAVNRRKPAAAPLVADLTSALPASSPESVAAPADRERSEADLLSAFPGRVSALPVAPAPPSAFPGRARLSWEVVRSARQSPTSVALQAARLPGFATTVPSLQVRVGVEVTASLAAPAQLTPAAPCTAQV